MGNLSLMKANAGGKIHWLTKTFITQSVGIGKGQVEEWDKVYMYLHMGTT